jgi:hypothetical protein
VIDYHTSTLSALRLGGSIEVALAWCDWKETPEAHVISVDVSGGLVSGKQTNMKNTSARKLVQSPIGQT